MIRRIFALAGLALTAACADPLTDRGAGFGPYGAERPATDALGRQSIGDDTLTALGLDPEGSDVEPIDNPGISDEQNFDAVSARETIESDAARLEAAARAYEVVEPEELPERGSGGGGPSIVAYALRTSNPVGVRRYDRGRPSRERAERACARYTSDDAAQEAFLRAGGPDRDRRGVDPDGDGFACDWDPRPFRAARGG